MAEKRVREVSVRVPKAHPQQARFIESPAKRKIVRAGRRGGKTVGVSILAVRKFVEDGRRVLYAAPTMEQVSRFWVEVVRALDEPIRAGIMRKNETEHLIERRGTEARIRAKTAWNADSLRGDYADVLILDEWQLMDEAAWEEVGAPMLLDNNGDAVFIYTPPSLRSRSVSKATDPQHAAKLFKKAKEDPSGRWQAFTFSSHDNPHISAEALAEITQDMTAVAYRQEIMAEDVDEAPGALWTREMLEASRVSATPADVVRRVVGLDPSATSSGDEAGIITVAQVGRDLYIEADDTLQGAPHVWARAACDAVDNSDADGIVAEKNQGGEMVSGTIATVNPKATVWLVHASRGKEPRAQPVASATRQGRIHMVGSHPQLEDELCLWVPGDRKSPNRLDAMVWACAWLMGIEQGQQSDVEMLASCVV